MASVDFTAIPTDMVAATPGSRGEEPAAREPVIQMHRIRTVRLQQGVSLRSASRQTGTEVRKLRAQEDEGADLRLSDLHKWSKALDVPLSELLVEPDTRLSRPVIRKNSSWSDRRSGTRLGPDRTQGSPRPGQPSSRA